MDTTRRHRRLRTLLVALVCAAGLAAPLAGTADAAPTGLDGIGPGAPLLVTRGGENFGCTANFIWTSGSNYYLGTAGHCLDGVSRVRVCASLCVFGSTTSIGNTLGLVEMCGPNTVGCSFPVLQPGPQGTDFGLIPVRSGLTGQLRKEVPVFGGPTGTTTVGLGSKLCMYGTGVGPGDTFAGRSRVLVGLTATSTTWYSHGVATPGDSGSPVVDCDTKAAVGFQTHIACGIPLNPQPAAVCGTTIARANALAPGYTLWT